MKEYIQLGTHHRKEKFFLGALALGLVLLSLFPAYGSPGEKACQVMHQELERKKQRISEYISGLQKFNDQNYDIAVIRAMNLKISELADQIFILEKDIADCDKQKSRGMNQGPNTVKSDEGWHATAKCGELRKKLVLLLQKVQNLKRRQNSLLSEFTPAESRELREVSQDLEDVRAALKTRCTPPAAPKPFRR